MKKLLYVSGGSVLLLLALFFGAFFASPLTASAQSVATTPTTTATKPVAHKHAKPLKKFVKDNSSQIVDQIAPQLHLSSAQLTQKLQSGEGLAKIAKGQSVSATSLKAILVKSVDTVVAQELKAGKIDQKQATLLDTSVTGHPAVVARVLHHYYYKK